MSTMNLREFVRVTLSEILAGVMDAQRSEDVGDYVAKGGIGTLEFPDASGVVHQQRLTATTVKFDVALTVQERAGAESGVGFDLGVVKGNLGGDLGGMSEGVSRVQFAVPIILPKSEDTRKAPA